jgi:IS5 family transposase
MSARILDASPEIAKAVHEDLLRGRRGDRGRPGLSGDQVARIVMLKQMHGLSYRELGFHLQDSAAFRAFVGLGFEDRPSYQALQANVKRMRPETWELINQTLIRFARDQGIERGRTIRGDTTVVDAAIHEPADSSLLWDCVRVATRLMHRITKRRPALRKAFSDHTRRAKRRAYTIKFHHRRKDRVNQYRDLIRVAESVHADAGTVVERTAGIDNLRSYVNELEALLPLMACVIDQTRRRVIHGEKVPSAEKIVSIFEPHTDIIVKDQRETRYGHKVCLTGGKSSLILDCVIEEGNPADATLIERTPSKQNVSIAKALGVQDIAFHQKRGIETTEMVRSAWVFRRLRDFRSGIEGCISTLKRAFHMDRCNWRSQQSFRAYVWSSVASFNLIAIARHLLAREFA